VAYKPDSLSVSEMTFPKLHYGFMIRYQIFLSFLQDVTWLSTLLKIKNLFVAAKTKLIFEEFDYGLIFNQFGCWWEPAP